MPRGQMAIRKMSDNKCIKCGKPRLLIDGICEMCRSQAIIDKWELIEDEKVSDNIS